MRDKRRNNQMTILEEMSGITPGAFPSNNTRGDFRRLPTKRDRVRRIGVMVVMLALLLPASYALADESGQEHQYVGARKCKTCHGKKAIGNQYDSWLETSHAKALESLATDKAKEWASEANVADPLNDEKCVKCHVTAYGVSEDLLGRKYARSEGVQCEACHGAGKDYRKKKYMVDVEVAESRGLIPQSEKVCLVCHNDESPAWDPERYTLNDGSKAGFDYDQAVAAIVHPVPEGYDPAAEGEAD
jgi:hypothetical protein